MGVGKPRPDGAPGGAMKADVDVKALPPGSLHLCSQACRKIPRGYVGRSPARVCVRRPRSDRPKGCR